MTKTSPATAKLASGSERECESTCPRVLNGSFQVTSISLLIAGELLSNCNKTEVRSRPHNNVPETLDICIFLIFTDLHRKNLRVFVRSSQSFVSLWFVLEFVSVV